MSFHDVPWYDPCEYPYAANVNTFDFWVFFPLRMIHILEFQPTSETQHNTRWMCVNEDAISVRNQQDRANKRSATAWSATLGGSSRALQRRTTEAKFKGLANDKPFYQQIIRRLLNSPAGT